MAFGVNEDEERDVLYAPLANKWTVPAAKVAVVGKVDAVAPHSILQALPVKVERVADNLQFLLHLAAQPSGTIDGALRAALPCGPEDEKRVTALEVLSPYGVGLGFLLVLFLGIGMRERDECEVWK